MAGVVFFGPQNCPRRPQQRKGYLGVSLFEGTLFDTSKL